MHVTAMQTRSKKKSFLEKFTSSFKLGANKKDHEAVLKEEAPAATFAEAGEVGQQKDKEAASCGKMPNLLLISFSFI